MTGTSRLPGGKPLKASQRGKRAAVPAKVTPSFHPGDRVRWKERVGIMRRDVGDGEHVEIAVGERVYRVRISELR